VAVQLGHHKAGVRECRVVGIVVGVHPTSRIETTEQFAGYLILDVKSHVQKVLSSHRAYKAEAAGLKADFSLGSAVVTLVLRIAAAEEHAVVVEWKTLGVEESYEVAVVPIAAFLPACRQVRVVGADDIVAVSLTGPVFHQASFRS